MRGRREQFQLTYAKVKVISMDKEDDQWVKKKKKKKEKVSARWLREVDAEQRRAHFLPPAV